MKAAEYNIQHNLNADVTVTVVNEKNEKVTGKAMNISKNVIWLKPDNLDYNQLTIEIRKMS